MCRWSLLPAVTLLGQVVAEGGVQLPGEGADTLTSVPDGEEEAVIESAEECPGECIFIEVG